MKLFSRVMIIALLIVFHTACTNPAPKKPDILVHKKPDHTYQTPSYPYKDETKKPTLPPKNTSPLEKPIFPEIDESQSIKIALLLPLSSSNKLIRKEANALLNAAEIALFQEDSKEILMILKDTQGKARIAAKMAQEAVQEGANLIIGPVLSNSVRSVAETLNMNTIMIALSSDTHTHYENVFKLGFPVEEDIRNLMAYLKNNKILENYAFFGSTSSYSKRAQSAFQTYILQQNANLTDNIYYTGKTYHDVQSAINQISKAGSNQIQAILIPEYGITLQTILPSLVEKGFYRHIQNPVLFLGTSLWMNLNLTKEPSIQNALFAAPSKDSMSQFEQKYIKIYKSPAERLSSLAYDAITLASYLALSPKHQWNQILTGQSGFYGVSGLFRFKSNGNIERTLSIYTIKGQQIIEESKALQAFLDSGAF